MAGWGISANAPEKEKIKAEYNDMLMGYNSCAEISYETYSKAYDIGMELFDRMYELGKKEATAYDIDKVVAQLQESSETFCKEYGLFEDENVLYLPDAIEIARKGGVDNG